MKITTATACFTLMLVSAANASADEFLLGLEYSQWLAPNAHSIATDNAGAIYVLTWFPISNETPPSSVTKLSADGKTILWQNQLGFAVSGMAVDPNGGVYVTPFHIGASGFLNVSVVKLSEDGKGLAWTSPVQIASILGAIPAFAADSRGRVYLAAFSPSSQGSVMRLNAAGTAAEYTKALAGWPISIAVDGSGAAFVAGYGFLARLAPDGSPGFFTPEPKLNLAPTVALDASGNAVVYALGVLDRFDASGTLRFSQTFPIVSYHIPGLTLDAVGNAYILGTSLRLHPVRNSLVPCGTELLSVVAPDGALLQTTYLPGAEGVMVATGRNSTVFVLGGTGARFAPTRTGPFPAAGTAGASFLLQLSTNASAETFSLACAGNGATNAIGPVAPGGILSLFGNGLGPLDAIQTQATAQSAFPVSAGEVEVTFDGKQAPLLWVQDSQINLIAPWSLTPGQTTLVCAAYRGVRSKCLTLPVAQISPGVFTVDGSYAAALNQDGTINTVTNPAKPGSIVSVFATGLGPIIPAQADGTLVGLPLPTNVLTLFSEATGYSIPFLGTRPAIPLEVTYAGPAPNLVAGASQINIRVVEGRGAIRVQLPQGDQALFQLHVGLP